MTPAAAPAFCGCPPAVAAWAVSATAARAARWAAGGRPRGGGAAAAAADGAPRRWPAGPLVAAAAGPPPRPPAAPCAARATDGAGASTAAAVAARVARPAAAAAAPRAQRHARRAAEAAAVAEAAAAAPPARREGSTPRRRRRRFPTPAVVDAAAADAAAAAASVTSTAAPSVAASATPAAAAAPHASPSPPGAFPPTTGGRDAPPPPPGHGGSRRTTRRNALALTSAFLVATAAVAAVPPAPARAIAVAPTPINPYARRRRIKAYKLYLEQLQKELNTVTAPAATTGVGTRPVLVPEADAPTVAAASFKVAGISAFVASAIATAICHPIDTWKALKQQERRNADGSADEASSVQAILGPSPVARLYRGVESNILKEAPNAAVYLAVYELIKTALLTVPFFAAHPLGAFLLAGALGDAVGSVVRVPAELINKRLQLGLNDTVGGAVRDQFLNESGVEVTLASWGAVLLRDMPYGAVQIGVYEQVKLAIASSPHPTVLSTLAAAVSHGSSAAAAGAGTGATAAATAASTALATPGILDDVLVGAFAGAFAAVLTTPMDVLVTRVAVQAPRCDLDTRRYAGVRSVLGRLLAEEGPSALWSGWLQRGLFYAPLIGLFFTLYEGTRYTVVHPQVLTDVAVAAEGLPAAAVHAIGTFARGVGQAAPATVACVGDWLSSTVGQP